MKNFSSLRDTIKGLKWEAIEGKNMFANHISNKGVVSAYVIFKFPQINKPDNLMESGEERLGQTLHKKKISKWPIT